MKKAVKSVFLLSLVILIISTVVGCGKKAQVANGPVEIEMWIMPNSLAPVIDLNEVLKKFHEANPNIRVKVTSIDWGASWTKIITAAASGDAPDIVQLGSTQVASLSALGGGTKLLDLTQKINEVNGGKDAFLAGAQRTMGIEGGDKITSVPWFVDARALYFRTDVLEKCGVKKTDLDTWDGFEKALGKIKDKKLVINGIKIEPLGIPGKNDWNVIHNLAPWIWAAGGNFFEPGNKKASLTSEQSINGLEFYIGLVKKGYVPEECLEQNTSQVEGGFNNGIYAMIFTGSNELRGLTTPQRQGGVMESPVARNFDIVPYPAGPHGRVTFMGGSNLAIFSTSTKQDAAWKVVKYLASKEAQVEYAKKSGFMPALKEAFEDPYFSADSKRRVYKTAVSYGQIYPSIPAWGPLEPVLIRTFGILWDHIISNLDSFNRNDIKSALIDADEQINKRLKQHE